MEVEKDGQQHWAFFFLVSLVESAHGTPSSIHKNVDCILNDDGIFQMQIHTSSFKDVTHPAVTPSIVMQYC